MRRLRNWVLFSLGATIGLATALFIAENRSEVVVEFVAWESVALPLWFALSIAFVAGAVVPRLLTAGATYRRVRLQSRLKSRLADLEAEVVRLRNIPLEALPQRPTDAQPDAHMSDFESHQSLVSGGRALVEDYDAFLLDGVGGQEVLPSEAIADEPDPYAAIFDQADPSVTDVEEAELYPAVIDAGHKGG